MDYYSLLSTNGLIFDTGPLLLLAFHQYAGGKYLERFSSAIPTPDLKPVARTIEALLSRVPRAAVTSYVLAEFHALARVRGRLNLLGMTSVISGTFELLTRLEEIEVGKPDILNTKLKNALQYCFTDKVF